MAAIYIEICAILCTGAVLVSGTDLIGIDSVVFDEVSSECRSFDGKARECRDNQCIFCCGDSNCYDVRDTTGPCQVGCPNHCGDEDLCKANGCVYNKCTEQCHGREAGCTVFDGESAETCEEQGCFSCCKDGYNSCFHREPEEECEVGPPPNDGKSPDDPPQVTFYEGCGVAVENFASITLPMRTYCINIPNIPISSTSQRTWREVISEVELTNVNNCILVFDQLNCCGNGVRLEDLKNNLCPGDGVDFDDKAQSYKQCPNWEEVVVPPTGR